MSGIRRWRGVGIVGVLTTLAIAYLFKLGPATAQINREDLRPGLVATYRDGTGLEILQLDPAMAFTLKAGEAAHPRQSATGGAITWEGYLNVFRPSDYKFSVLLRGKFKLTVDGKDVLNAEANADPAALKEGQTVKLAAGAYPLRAEFTRLPGDARLEVYWQAPIFIKEPLPLANLKHLPNKTPKQLAEDRLTERGRFVVEEMGCVNCHKPAANDKVISALDSRKGPDLSKVGERLQAGWIYTWLRDPQAVSPDAAMPRLFHDKESGPVELYAATRYLESLGGAMKSAAMPPKVADSIKRGRQLFSAVGCVVCHPLALTEKAKPGAPLLHHLVSSSEPSRTFVLPDQGSKTTPNHLAAYLQNPHKTDPSGRMPSMMLDGKDALDLANYLCYGAKAGTPVALPNAPPAAEAAKIFQRLVADEKERMAFDKLAEVDRWRALGRQVIVERGCNQCHTIEPGGKPLPVKITAPGIENLKKKLVLSTGCLAQDVKSRGKAPDYAFTMARSQQQDDFVAVLQFFGIGTSGAGSPSPIHSAKVALQRFNCLACHNRDGEGGLTPELVTELRQFEKAENAEAINPPTLTGVAHKLRTAWFRDVLTKGGRSRPWMSLRMPQFGDAHVGKLPEAIAAVEGTTPDDNIHTVGLKAATIKAGRQLIGKNNGYSCISCHDIAGVPNKGTRGPDLALTSQHVRYEWYRRWLESAQRMDPGTKMPSIILDGRTMLDTVLGGNADLQAEAMWAYLSLGPTLQLPEGLEPPKGLILTVTDRPVLLRTFMPETNPRSIAVGYPEGVSAVFDATVCRLGYAWNGNFLDATPVWANRGGSPAKLLGTKFWSAPPGFPWGLGDKLPPDFAAISKDPAFGAGMPEGVVFRGDKQLFFDGYKLDGQGLPSFHYHFGRDATKVVSVVEKPLPLRGAAAVGLARHIEMQNRSGLDVWLNAAVTAGSSKKVRVIDGKGNEVALDLKDGVEFATGDRFIVLPQDGERVSVASASAAAHVEWHLHLNGGGWQFLLRCRREAPSAVVTVSVWSLPRDEPALLREVLPAK